MTPFALSGVMIVATAIPIGAMVAFRQMYRPTNVTYSLFYGLAIALWGASCIVIGSTTNPTHALLAWKIGHTGVILITVFHYHFAYVFCGVKKPAVLTGVYAFAVASISLNFFGTSLVRDVRYAFNSFYYSVPGGLYVPFFVSWLLIVALAYHELEKRRRALTGVERIRINLWILSSVIGFSGGTMNFIPVFGLDVYPWGNFAISIAALVQVYAIFVYRFLDVEILVKRTLIYSALAALITATYLVTVLVMEKWFQGFFGYRSIIATVLVGFVIAICFNPVRNRVQAFVDRALFKATTAELVAQREQLLAEVRRSEHMKAVGTLAAGLAHEIKNPLASIKTFTEHLESRHSDPEFLAKFHKIVGGEVERINLIVQQLLDFAKPVPPKLTPVELGHLLDTTLELLNSEILQRHVEVKRVYGTNHVVLGDQQQLEQVFLNLLLNSLQAMNGTGFLEIRTDLQGAELRVTITDNGPGINSKVLPRIFEPFFTTKETGTGLGLAVVQGIVKEHGGRINVESQVGLGTTVRLYLPVAV